MFNRDVAGGIVSILIGATYLYVAYGIHASALDDTVGPGGLPRAYGWIMIALGLIVTAKAAIGRMRMAGDSEFARDWAGTGVKCLRAGGLLAIGAAYLLIVTPLGYAPAIALLIAAVAAYQGATLNWRLAGIAIAGAFVLWAAFVLLLGVSMPKGLLGMP